MIHDIENIRKALAGEGIEMDSRFDRAFRKLSNPGGCEHCGARTKVGVEAPAKGKVPAYMKTACCGTKIG